MGAMEGRNSIIGAMEVPLTYDIRDDDTPKEDLSLKWDNNSNYEFHLSVQSLISIKRPYILSF